MTRALLTIAAFAVGACASCGWAEREMAKTLGVYEHCHDGVLYLQFTSGATVKYGADGRVTTCEEARTE